MDMLLFIIQPLYRKNFFPNVSRLFRETVGQLPPYHPLDYNINVNVAGPVRTDQLSIPHNCNVVGNPEDFLHLMGNVDDSLSLLLQSLNNPH